MRYFHFPISIHSIARLHRIATNTHAYICCDSTLRLAFITVVVLFANRFELNWNEEKNAVQNRSSSSSGGGSRSAYTIYESHIRDGVYLIMEYATPSNYSVEQSKNEATRNLVVVVKYPLWINHNAYYFIISFTIDNMFFFGSIVFLFYSQWRQSHELRAI